MSRATVEQDTPVAEATVGARRGNPYVAIALSLIPGLGQLYNREPRKGVIFLLATLLTLGPSLVLITAGERLGSTLLERKQFAAFLALSFGSVVLFLVLFILGLAFWASAAIDARRTALSEGDGDPVGHRWWFLRL